MGWEQRKPDLLVRGADADGEVLAAFYAGYDRAFLLPDEKEDLAGFRACLSLNGSNFAWSPHLAREVVLAASDPTDGRPLAGANFLATMVGARIAVALNYVYVEPSARGRGLLRRMLDAVCEAARFYLAAPDLPATLFIEQNDPLRLSPERYRADSAYSGIDQVDRLDVWARVGARLVDLDYVQPPLSPGQEAESGLVYAALRHEGDSVDGEFLAAHLTSFFGISVLKGQDPRRDPVAGPQIVGAATAASVALYPMEPAIAALRAQSPAHARSLLDLARKLK